MKKRNNKLIRQQVLEKYGGKCAYCGVDLTLSTLNIDHIKPIFRKTPPEFMERYYHTDKGTDNIENYNPSCKSCNSLKHTWTIEQFRREINLKHERLLKTNPGYRLLLKLGIIIKKEENAIFYYERVEQ